MVNKRTHAQKDRDGKDYRQITWGDFTVNQLAELHPCQAGSCYEVSWKDGRVRGFEPALRSGRNWTAAKEGGWPSPESESCSAGFEERKLVAANYTQADFVEAVPANCNTLKPVDVLLCCTAAPPLITPGGRAQAEPSKFPADTVWCFEWSSWSNKSGDWGLRGEPALVQVMRRHCTGAPISAAKPPS